MFIPLYNIIYERVDLPAGFDLPKALLQAGWYLWGYPLSTYAKLSEKLSFLTPWYAHVRNVSFEMLRNVSFSQNFAYVLNGWPISKLNKTHKKGKRGLKKAFLNILKVFLKTDLLLSSANKIPLKSPLKHLTQRKMVLKRASGSKKLHKFSNIDFMVGGYTNKYSTTSSLSFAGAAYNLLNQN